MTVPRLLLSPEEAAQALNVSRSALYALLRSGALESVRVGRLRRIPEDSLRAYVAALPRSA